MAKRRGHGEGSIYQRNDGRWTASLTVEGRKRKYFYGKTRGEVRDQLTKALHDKKEGVLITAPNEKVSQFLNRWLEDVAKPSVRPRTYEVYALNIRRVLPHVGDLRMSALTPAAVQKCYGALLASGLSKRSVEQAHTVLHTALTQALKWNLIGRNPTEAVSVPRPEHKEMHTYTAGQVQQLFDKSADDRLHALWVLLATTGLRLGEATGLRWEDVDLSNARLAVRRALQWQKGVGAAFVEPKSQQSRRTVYLARGTVIALQEHRKRQVAERLHAGPAWEDDGLVFCGRMGKPIDPARVSDAFHSALEAADLPRIRIHDLRHTAASLLFAKDVHPKLVQEMLGHSTVTLTLNTYSHVIPVMHTEVARHMDDLFSSVRAK